MTHVIKSTYFGDYLSARMNIDHELLKSQTFLGDFTKLPGDVLRGDPEHLEFVKSKLIKRRKQEDFEIVKADI